MTTDYAHALFFDLDNAVHNVDNLVDGIYAVQECVKPPAIQLSPWMCAYECTLRTKYYTADVRLCTVDNCQHVDAVTQHADNIESLVLHFDGASLDEHTAAHLVGVLQPSMGLLVCDRVADACREQVHVFCIEHHFELVELDPDQEHIDEANECAEKWGIARVVQALQSHTWPNAQLFNDTNSHKSTAACERACSRVNHNRDAVIASSSQTCSSAARVDDRLFESESHEQILKAIAVSADESTSFEELFDKFAHLKAHAQTIQDDDERKRFAEKLALQFMSAMGCVDGDDEPDESDLSNASDDEQLDSAHKLVEQDKS